MKRNISLVFLVLTCLTSTAQSQNSISNFLPTRSSKVVYKNVVEEEEISMDDFGEKGVQWMKDHQMKDLDLSYPDEKRVRLKGQHSMKLLWGPNDFKELYKTIICDVEIVAKRERYQYRLYHFKVQESGSETQLEIYKKDEKKTARYNEAFYKSIDAEVKLLIEDLKLKMRAPKPQKPSTKTP